LDKTFLAHSNGIVFLAVRGEGVGVNTTGFHVVSLAAVGF
jgi:hypothetical protein